MLFLVSQFHELTDPSAPLMFGHHIRMKYKLWSFLLNPISLIA